MNRPGYTVRLSDPGHVERKLQEKLACDSVLPSNGAPARMRLILAVIAMGFGSWANASTTPSQLVLLGQDAQRRAFSTVFTVDLRAERPVVRYDQPIQLDIRFNTIVDRSDVAEFLAEEAQEIHDLSPDTSQRLEETIVGALGCDFRSGSMLQIHFKPGEGALLRCDEGTESLVTYGPMSFYLLDVFLHPETEFSGLVVHRENT